MNQREFIASLSTKSGLSTQESEKQVDNLLKVMKTLWADNDSISISGFGVLEVKKKRERVSVNPGNGQRMLIPPKLALSYKPSALLKNKAN